MRSLRGRVCAGGDRSVEVGSLDMLRVSARGRGNECVFVYVGRSQLRVKGRLVVHCVDRGKTTMVVTLKQ